MAAVVPLRREPPGPHPVRWEARRTPTSAMTSWTVRSCADVRQKVAP